MPQVQTNLPCPECNGRLILKNSRYGKFYGCVNYPHCTACHGAHPDGTPLGIPADKETKRWRIQAHRVFDRLWKHPHGIMRRAQAYRLLQRRMNMTPKECHIGRFDIEQCQRVIAICQLKSRRKRRSKQICHG